MGCRSGHRQILSIAWIAICQHVSSSNGGQHTRRLLILMQCDQEIEILGSCLVLGTGSENFLSLCEILRLYVAQRGLSVQSARLSYSCHDSPSNDMLVRWQFIFLEDRLQCELVLTLAGLLTIQYRLTPLYSSLILIFTTEVITQTPHYLFMSAADRSLGQD